MSSSLILSLTIKSLAVALLVVRSNECAEKSSPGVICKSVLIFASLFACWWYSVR